MEEDKEEDAASRRMHDYLEKKQRRQEEYWLRKYGKVLNPVAPPKAEKKTVESPRAGGLLPPINHRGQVGQAPMFQAAGPIKTFPMKGALMNGDRKHLNPIPQGSILPPLNYRVSLTGESSAGRLRGNMMVGSPKFSKQLLGSCNMQQHSGPVLLKPMEHAPAVETQISPKAPDYISPKEQHHKRAVRDLQMELAVLKTIKGREDVLDRLKTAGDKLSATFGGAAPSVMSQADPLVRLFYRLINTLRQRTLDTIECVVAWRRKTGTNEAFMYYGKDYMANIGPDLQFLDDHSFLSGRLNQARAVDDPFIVWLTPDGVPIEEATTVDHRRAGQRFTSDALRIRMARKAMAAYHRSMAPRAHGERPFSASSFGSVAEEGYQQMLEERRAAAELDITSFLAPVNQYSSAREPGAGSGHSTLQQMEDHLHGGGERRPNVELDALVKEALVPLVQLQMLEGGFQGESHGPAVQVADILLEMMDATSLNLLLKGGSALIASRVKVVLESLGIELLPPNSARGTVAAPASGDGGLEPQESIEDGNLVDGVYAEPAAALDDANSMQQSLDLEELPNGDEEVEGEGQGAEEEVEEDDEEMEQEEEEEEENHLGSLTAASEEMEAEFVDTNAPMAELDGEEAIEEEEAVVEAQDMFDEEADLFVVDHDNIMQSMISAIADILDLDDGHFIDFALGAIVESLSEPFVSQIPEGAFTVAGWEIDRQLDALIGGLDDGLPNQAPGSTYSTYEEYSSPKRSTRALDPSFPHVRSDVAADRRMQLLGGKSDVDHAPPVITSAQFDVPGVDHDVSTSSAVLPQSADDPQQGSTASFITKRDDHGGMSSTPLGYLGGHHGVRSSFVAEHGDDVGHGLRSATTFANEGGDLGVQSSTTLPHRSSNQGSPNVLEWATSEHAATTGRDVRASGMFPTHSDSGPTNRASGTFTPQSAHSGSVRASGGSPPGHVGGGSVRASGAFPPEGVNDVRASGTYGADTAEDGFTPLHSFNPVQSFSSPVREQSSRNSHSNDAGRSAGGGYEQVMRSSKQFSPHVSDEHFNPVQSFGSPGDSLPQRAPSRHNRTPTGIRESYGEMPQSPGLGPGRLVSRS